MSERKMTGKERLFCRYYGYCGNLKEAAVKAGFVKDPEKEGIELLLRGEIREEISSVAKKLDELESVCRCAWNRLALGSAADAVRLLFRCDEQAPDGLEKMDLSCIAEIKKPKGEEWRLNFLTALRLLKA